MDSAIQLLNKRGHDFLRRRGGSFQITIMVGEKKTIFLCAVNSPMLPPQEQEKLIAEQASCSFHLSLVPWVLSVFTVEEPGLKRISVPSTQSPNAKTLLFPVF